MFSDFSAGHGEKLGISRAPISMIKRPADCSEWTCGSQGQDVVNSGPVYVCQLEEGHGGLHREYANHERVIACWDEEGALQE